MGISADFARDETLFAGTETGIFRSTNGGRAWHCRPTMPTMARFLSERNHVVSFVQAIADAVGRAWVKSSLIAPQGLGLDEPLLVGLANGGVVRV